MSQITVEIPVLNCNNRSKIKLLDGPLKYYRGPTIWYFLWTPPVRLHGSQCPYEVCLRATGLMLVYERFVSAMKVERLGIIHQPEGCVSVCELCRDWRVRNGQNQRRQQYSILGLIGFIKDWAWQKELCIFLCNTRYRQLFQDPFRWLEYKHSICLRYLCTVKWFLAFVGRTMCSSTLLIFPAVSVL